MNKLIVYNDITITGVPEGETVAVLEDEEGLFLLVSNSETEIVDIYRKTVN